MATIQFDLGHYKDEVIFESNDPFSSLDLFKKYMTYLIVNPEFKDIECFPFKGGETYQFKIEAGYPEREYIGKARMRIGHNEK